MIIGETFNNQYDGYEEDSYDYLFKRRSKEERQQKKAERKEKRAERKEAKRDPATGEKKKLQIFKNFGLFDKNKNKNKTAGSTTTPGSSAKTGSASSPSSGESKPTPDNATAAAGAQDNTDNANSSSGESGAGTEGAKMEGNTQDTGGSPKKEAGMGAVFGFVALGVVVTIIGVVLFRLDKKSNPAPQPLRAAA